MKTSKIVSKLFVLILFISFFSSCSNTKIIDNHNSKISLDWQGIYKGTIPAASSPGIELTLIIEDTSYIAYSNYLERGDSIYSNNGPIEWNSDGSSLTLIDNNDFLYKIRVLENRLQILDREGNIIEGSLEDLYFLNKIDSSLFDKKLKINRVGDILIDNNNLLKEPFLYFDLKRGSFSGTSGCNNFFGKYTTGANNSIKFENIASTKMYCNNIHIEDSLFKAMSKIEQFTITKDTLKFSDKTNTTILETIINNN